MLPELRDDKTPFFQEVETELLQSDVTPEAVESAYVAYLRKLDEVARLDIAGFCEDIDTKTIHVCGRTAGTPPTFYYRRRQNGEWNGWNVMPLDITSDHVALIVYRRRPYIFWLTFAKRADDPEPEQLVESASGEQRKSQTLWNATLAWSECRDGQWSAKRVALISETFTHTEERPQNHHCLP